jgi:CubicO group peptidase (beta-lactamase class C family)
MTPRYSAALVTVALGLALTSAGAAAVHYLTTDQLATRDAYVEQASEDWEIPGLSLTIVQGDSVVYTKGYGVRELGKPDPVDEHTLYAIGSNTKSTAAALVGMLVDDGKMHWDDPVWRYLLQFRVADPYGSQEATRSRGRRPSIA